jgi:hypothetical protein
MRHQFVGVVDAFGLAVAHVGPVRRSLMSARAGHWQSALTASSRPGGRTRATERADLSQPTILRRLGGNGDRLVAVVQTLQLGDLGRVVAVALAGDEVAPVVKDLYASFASFHSDSYSCRASPVATVVTVCLLRD